MTDNTQPEALDLADWLEAVGGGPSAKRCAALLREQHTRITELESQLAQRFDAADMATAAAQGFRDGAASAMAGEPMAWMTFTEEGDPAMVFLDRLEACQYCEDDDPPKPLYLAAPPTAQAEEIGRVPVEPTTDQEWAGKQAVLRGLTMAAACMIYKAMLAAAPLPPTSANAGEPVAWQYRSLRDSGAWFDCTKERFEMRCTQPEIWETRALYAAPPTAQT